MKPDVLHLSMTPEQGGMTTSEPVYQDISPDGPVPCGCPHGRPIPDIHVTMDQGKGELTSESDEGNHGNTAQHKIVNDASDIGMATQIVQLQDMVKEMKEGFGSALEALSQIQYGDQVLSEKVASNKVEYEQQLGDVVQMVLSLKTEFTAVAGKLQAATENQTRLEKHVECLQYERDIMLEELERAGAISQQIRQKYHSGRSRPNGLNRSSDSTTLTSLLERAHSVFGTPTSHNVSDRDSGVNTYRDHADLCSCGDVTPPSVNPMVQSYIAGLQDSVHHISSHGLQSSFHQMPSQDTTRRDPYDSDSSLTQAANKSLDLSRSLGDKCAAAAVVDSSDDEDAAKEDERTQDAGAEESQMEDDRNNMEKHDVESSPEKSSPLNQNVFVQPMTPGRIAPHERNTKEVQRLRVAREIMDTERKYCSNLWTILDLYVEPLHSSGILSAKETSIMFPACLTTIYDHHCGFLQKLEERMSNWKYHSVLGDILCRFLETSECDLLVQYQTYVGDFPASLYQIRKSCKHTARFRKYLRGMQRHPSCEGLDIGSFMVTPIQRIPRYVLLLKQLLKHTDREHPDHYYLETALERLGDFLDKLNDSIEYSMRMVSSDISPKPRRKLRIGSFRSTSMSSYDANNSKANDTTLPGDDHSILSTSTTGSHSRFFNFSFLRDSFRRKQSQVQVTQSYSTPMHGQVPPVNLPAHSIHLDTPVRSVAHPHGAPSEQSFCENRSYTAQADYQRDPVLSHSFMNGSARDHSFSGVREQSYANNSLPVKSEKKKRHKHRRPRSGHDRSKVSNQMNARKNADIYEPVREKKLCKQWRPQSFSDQTSEASLRSSTVTPQTPWSGAPSQESLHTLTGDTQTMSSLASSQYRHPQEKLDSTENLQQDPQPQQNPAYEMSEMAKSLPDISTRQNGIVRSTGRKLPVPPKVQVQRNDYGIYGDNDDLMDEEPRNHAASRTQSHVVDRNRARSATHVNSIGGSHSPSQQYINMALARSLTENHLDSAGPMAQSLPRTSTSLIERPKSQLFYDPKSRPPIQKPRPHSARPRHVTLPREDVPPQIWESGTQTMPQEGNGHLNATQLQSDVILQLTPKKEGPSKRKKERLPKKCKDENLDVTLDKEKKKGSIKESLKNIFFRKRGSKMFDIAPLEEFPEHGHQVYTSVGTPYRTLPRNCVLADRDFNASPREQDPPRETVVILDPIQPELESYEDEDGEPCSAV